MTETGDPLPPLESRIIRSAHVVQDRNGQWRVKGLGGNGETILTSEQYTNVEWAHQVALDLRVPVEFFPYDK